MSLAAAVACAAASAIVLLRGPHGTPIPNQAILLVGFVALGVFIWRGPSAAGRTRPLVLGMSGALLVLAVIVPPTQSGDVWAYAMYGRILSEHHDSPYTHAAADYPTDPASRRVDPVWRKTRSVYGPAFTVVSAGGMWAAGTSRLAARLFFQVLAALAAVALLSIVDRRTRDPVALACLGLNPALVIGVVNNAHNDVLVGLAVLGACLLVRDGRVGWAALAGALGALVKVVALLPLGAVGWWLWRRRGWRTAVAFGAGVLLTVSVGFGLAGGRAVVDPLKVASRQFTGTSIWNGPQRWVSEDKVDQGVAEGRARVQAGKEVARVAAVAVFALGFLLVAPRVGAATAGLAAGAAVFAYMLAGAYVYPWYVAWTLGVLALHSRSRFTWLVLGHAAAMQLAIVRDPRLLGRFEPLSMLSASQRLLDDIFRVWFPMLQVVLIFVVTVASVRALVRARPRAPSGPAVGPRGATR